MGPQHPSPFLARAFKAPSAAQTTALRLVDAVAALAALQAQSNYAMPEAASLLDGTLVPTVSAFVASREGLITRQEEQGDPTEGKHHGQ